MLDKYYSRYINFSVFKTEKFISDNKLSNDFIKCMYSMETYEQLRYVLLDYLKDFYDELEISKINQIATNYIHIKLPKKKRNFKTLAEYYQLIK